MRIVWLTAIANAHNLPVNSARNADMPAIKI